MKSNTFVVKINQNKTDIQADENLLKNMNLSSIVHSQDLSMGRVQSEPKSKQIDFVEA